MSKVVLANGRSFESAPEVSILESALAAGVVLPYSCRTGRCGTCKVRVVEGQTSGIMPEQSLTQQELTTGFILTCCRSAVTELALDIHDLGALANIPRKLLPCRIDALEHVANGVISVLLRLPPKESFYFLPGQYINIISRNGHRRSYSIANAPREDGKILLYIKHLDGGTMSQYWFSEARVNDLLRLEGPSGTFFLREGEESTMVLLATGTGIAPVKALLEQMDLEAAKYADKRIVVYWGVRSEADIYWNPAHLSLKVEFLPVISRPMNGWSGSQGYVQNVLAECDVDFSDAVIYACGSEHMINDAALIAEKRGLIAGKFLSDAFVSSSDLG